MIAAIMIDWTEILRILRAKTNVSDTDRQVALSTVRTMGAGVRLLPASGVESITTEWNKKPAARIGLDLPE